LCCHPECLIGFRSTEGGETLAPAVAPAQAGVRFQATGFPPSRERGQRHALRESAADGNHQCFQQYRRVRRVSSLFFINIVAIANMSLFKSLVFINIVGVTECFFSRPRGSLKAIPFAFNRLAFSNLARNVCKCPRFINIVGSRRRGLSVPPAALRENALSVYHYGKYVKTNNVYLQGTSASAPFRSSGFCVSSGIRTATSRRPYRRHRCSLPDVAPTYRARHAPPANL